jgi:uncharacterized repeat protein (TIGR03847 family)
MTGSFELGDVDAFTTGTVGPPGQRVFYLQARAGGQMLTFKCEKEQVGRLGEFLAELVNQLPTPSDGPLPGSLELSEPVLPEFIVGPIAVAYDEEIDRVVVVLQEVVPTDEEGEPLTDVDQSNARVHLTRGQAVAFSERAEAVVGAGRPSCRWCGRPIDPEGHPCPRMN